MSKTSDTDVKPNIDEKPEIKPGATAKMQIAVLHDGRSIKFAVKPTQKLQKVFDAAATALNMETKTLKFFLNGKRLRGMETPEELDMEEDDQIDAMLEQVGGSLLKYL